MEDSIEIWPVGLRFKPTEDELVDYHLRRKLRGEVEAICIIPELNIYQWEPQDLFVKYNALSMIPSDGHECFFFCSGDNKILNGLRPSRKTQFGFWKETSKKRVVRAVDTGEEIGFKRIFSYYKGRQGDARSTHFGMHKYHLNLNVPDSQISHPMEFVLCHITNRKCEKSGSGSATMSATENLSTPLTLNNSEYGRVQDFSEQGHPEVIVELENSSCTTLKYDLPDCSVSASQQPDTLGVESSFCNYNWLLDGTIDEQYLPCSPINGIHLSELWNFN